MTKPQFLYHYYELENGPFRNITETGLEKAIEIQNRILEGFNSKRPDNYLELRFTLEKRLKEQFILKGGMPTRNDPYYFTLGACDWVKSWYVNPGVIRIPLSDFKPKHMSFTYPDSMVSFQLHDQPRLAPYRKKLNGQVFLLSEIDLLIHEYGLPSEDKWQSEESLKYDRYIEAQIWDDSIVKTYQP